jgi:hypothetical protein
MVYFGDFVRRFALGFAIFTSAFLLSQVQLLLGKFLLPWFGGTFRNDFVLLTTSRKVESGQMTTACRAATGKSIRKIPASLERRLIDWCHTGMLATALTANRV